MDLLLRFWDGNRNLVATRYMTSLFFGRTKAVDITDLLLNIHDGYEVWILFTRVIYNTVTNRAYLSFDSMINYNQFLYEIWNQSTFGIIIFIADGWVCIPSH